MFMPDLYTLATLSDDENNSVSSILTQSSKYLQKFKVREGLTRLIKIEGLIQTVASILVGWGYLRPQQNL
jgi:hypothetical protein